MSGPLSGYRIVDFSTALAAPWTAGLLCDQGADVIKVERPSGDIGRTAGLSRGGITAMFHMANRGKRSIALDLTKEEGRAIAQQLAAAADVVVHNYRPAIAARLGVDYDQLRALREDIIVVSVTGFGPDGPDAVRPAFDSAIQAESGVVDILSGDGEEPVFEPHTLVDKVTAMAAAQAAVAALLARERGRGGQRVDVAMRDVAVSFMWVDGPGEITLLDVERGPGSASVTGGFRRFLDMADGRCVVSLSRPADLKGVSQVFGIDLKNYPKLTEPGGARRHPKVLDEFFHAVNAAAGRFSVEAASARLTEAGVVFGVVRKLGELHKAPNIIANGLLQESDHPLAGRIRETRPPVRFSAADTPVPGTSPGVGEHTDEILAELGRKDMAELRSAGVVA